MNLAAGRLSPARAATESLPAPQRTGVTELDMVRRVILAEVAVRTDDRTLLQQMVNDARDAYSTASSAVRRAAAHVLALAAWQRDDVHDAMRWLGGITLFESPVSQVLDQLILGARVASAAGDAGLRARVLQAIDLLDRERPAIPLFTGVARHARGILERDAQTLLAAADVLHSSSRPLLYAAAAEDAGAELAAPTTLTRRSISSMPPSTPTWTTKRSPMHAGLAASCAGWVCNGASSTSRGQKRAGTASPTPNSRLSTSSRRASPTGRRQQLQLSLTRSKTTCTTRSPSSASAPAPS